MNIRHLIQDIYVLRTKVCQDFFKMIVKDNWQNELYDKALYEKRNNGGNNYQKPYKKMREIGIENYRVEDMDVPLISSLVSIKSNFSCVKKVKKETYSALKELKMDRHEVGHSGAGESEKELFLQGFLYISKIKRFVEQVDDNEEDIPDDVRQTFLQKYLKKINELEITLDEERIESLQWKKEIEEDIKKIISSKDPGRVWCDVFEKYIYKYLTPNPYPERSRERYGEFLNLASHSGIYEAHFEAAYFGAQWGDFDLFEHHLSLLFETSRKINIGDAHSIISYINQYIKSGRTLTENLMRVIRKIQSDGTVILTKNDEGLYTVERKK